MEKGLPGASLVCLVALDGGLIAHTRENSTQHEETLVAVAALRRAALKFAQALNQAECRIIHIVGDESVLSCYDVNGSSMVAFYSDPPSDGFDAMDAEVARFVDEVVSAGFFEE